MDVQFYGANCLVFANKELRIVVDDYPAQRGAKSVIKPDDVVLFTGAHEETEVELKMIIDMPGEYETSGVSIVGIPARSHMSDDTEDKSVTVYKISVGDMVYVVLGHIYPELSDDQLEAMGMVDVLFVPVGGHGYTLDPAGALKVTRTIDPKIVVPTHYADKGIKYDVPQVSLEEAVKEFAMEPKEKLEKLKLKTADLAEVTQLYILEKS